MGKRYVLGIGIGDRVHDAPAFQKILTECGCYIKTRIGLHETSDNFCSPAGLILLEIFGGDAAIEEMETKLKAVQGLQVQKMVFDM
ncbi:MAG: hypothetical protein ABFD12_07275 [Syntrophorhabdus sp.]